MSRIRCGQCRGRHSTVAEVRTCFEVKGSSRKRQRKGRQKGPRVHPKPKVGSHYTRAGASTAPPPPTSPDHRADAPLNNLGTGRTRDVTMWERPEWERDALVRLRQLDQEDY